MSATRPLVQVHGVKRTSKDEKITRATVSLPAIFSSPIRPDLIHDVFVGLAKNSRQPYAVSSAAGHQTSAESWGTGRAVARIPRVPGGGTHRAGQGAFGNMCRGGRMFAPTKTWRRWHRRVNLQQKRYALVSAVSASGVTSLVMARGHRIQKLPEVPLVVANEAIDGISKTKDAVSLLKRIGAYADVEKVKASKKIRSGVGKRRNRRYVKRRGPLIVYLKKGTAARAFRNIPGVELCSVERLNLLQLAPGGHLGRFIIWTRDAFERLDAIYGTYDAPSKVKRDFSLPRPKVTNSDLVRLINSDEIQSLLKPKKRTHIYPRQRKNPLKNRSLMIRLNPYERTRIRSQLLREERAKKNPAPKGPAINKARRKLDKARKKRRAPYYKALLSNPCVYESDAPPKTRAGKLPEASD